MARPNKTGKSNKEEAVIGALRDAADRRWPLMPTNVETLQATVDALLERIGRKNEEEAWQLGVYIELLGALDAYWSTIPSNPLDTLRATRECSEISVMIDAISRGESTKQTHCKETIILQGRILDRYLDEHSDFVICRNAQARKDWLQKHASAIDELITPVPCFCSYLDKFVTDNWTINPHSQEKLKDVWVQPKWIDGFLARVLTAARLRDALLAMLHGTTVAQVMKIKTQPSLFTRKLLPPFSSIPFSLL
jgi:hypothetical protein